MKVLRVGDPHIKVGNLAEADKLMAFVLETAQQHKVDRIEILGDLMHTHAVIRMEVLNFWDSWLNILGERFDLWVLVGNHDLSGDFHMKTNALSVFKRRQNVKLIDGPRFDGIYAYMPYIHNNNEFVETANLLAGAGAKVLICHQTFAGSKYENGFYAPDGINPDLLQYSLIISGHIHSRQRFGKVIYPGTAYWQGASDANEPKGLWLVEHDKFTGVILKEEFISTEKVVTPLFSFVWKEGQEKPILPENSRATVELVGSSDWISKNKTTLKGKVSISTKITDKVNRENRKAGNSLEEFIANTYTTTVDKTTLLKYMKEIGLV